MAAKRFFDDSGTNPDQPNGKRLKNKPSFASVIGEVVMVNFLQNFCTALEPMLRKVVHEEVENGLRRECSRAFTRSPSLQIQSLEPSNLQLTFSKGLSLPIFTGSKIVDIDNSPLQILLVDTTTDQLIPTSLSSPLKIEIVVLDGDFPPGGREAWTNEEFNRNVVKERTGKRPLLAGELQVTMRDGVVSVGELEFTDNSSWIRSRKFRIGARVVVQGGGGQGVKVREAMTEAFVVKDHRGELYKKHHPPMLDDEVWRLEKIGKGGAFHTKLTSMGVTTVQEFLKLSVVEPSKLRKILGGGMSEKMWEVTLKHARTCVLGSKLYICRGPNYLLILNPICQVVKAVINGQTYSSRDLPTINRAYVENFVKEAYLNWNSLEEVDGVLNEVPLLTQGDVEEYPNHQQSIARQYQQHDFLTDGSNEVNYVPNSANMECNAWLLNSSSTYFGSSSETGVRYNLSENSSDGELTPVRSFIHED